MSFTVKLEGLTELLDMLNPEPAKLAVRATLERVANSGRSAAIDQVTQVYNIKKSDLNSETKTGGARIQVLSPRADNLKAVITIRGKGMSLAYFGAKQITGSRVLTRKQKEILTRRVSRKSLSAGPLPQGVLVQVFRGKETALLRNAFLAKMPNGHIGVFRRVTGKMMKGKNRQAIAEKSVISIASMVSNPMVEPAVMARMQERWDVEWPRQLAYYRNRNNR